MEGEEQETTPEHHEEAQRHHRELMERFGSMDSRLTALETRQQEAPQPQPEPEPQSAEEAPVEAVTEVVVVEAVTPEAPVKKQKRGTWF